MQAFSALGHHSLASSEERPHLSLACTCSILHTYLAVSIFGPDDDDDDGGRGGAEGINGRRLSRRPLAAEGEEEEGGSKHCSEKGEREKVPSTHTQCP